MSLLLLLQPQSVSSAQNGLVTQIHASLTLTPGTQAVVPTVIVPYNYTYAGVTTIPTTDTDLANAFTSTNYTQVATVDSVFFDETGGSVYNLQQFKYQNANSTDGINISWTGKSTEACSTATTHLEIYNYNTPAWESLSTDSATAAGSTITLTGSKPFPTNYYATGHWVAVRVWQ